MQRFEPTDARASTDRRLFAASTSAYAFPSAPAIALTPLSLPTSATELLTNCSAPRTEPATVPSGSSTGEVNASGRSVFWPTVPVEGSRVTTERGVIRRATLPIDRTVDVE